MTPATSFAGQKVALFGLGGSGLATLESLKAGGADVLAWDDSAGSREKAQARGLTVADLRFDLDTLEAERSGERLKLNPTTRRILIVLMQNSHRVVTRAELERELWGDEPPEGDFLRAHMHALRTAIDKNYPDKLLHTVHGTGYRLSPDPART